MSGDIIISSTTTVQDLHNQIYDDNLDTYAQVYADLLAQYPEFSDLINDATIFSYNFELQQSAFYEYANAAIGDIYSDIGAIGINPDPDEVDPIIPELE